MWRLVHSHSSISNPRFPGIGNSPHAHLRPAPADALNRQSKIDNQQSLLPHFLFFKVTAMVSTRNFL
jgi:hypothetical protein